MPENNYLVRAPLLDPKQQVIGYKLAWQTTAMNRELSADADRHELLTLVAGQAQAAQLGLLFLDAMPATLAALPLQTLPPETTVLVLKQQDLADADHVALIASWRDQGFGLALCEVDLAGLKSNEALLACATCLEVAYGHPDLAAISRLARDRSPTLSVVVDQLPGWSELDACAALGLGGFFENLCLTPRQLGPARTLGPQAVLILQLMQMVQDNADVRHLENVLKRDATISYKLFRYINSPGFGLEVEIQSLRHAVAMLGYTPLFRWLSVLLATTSTTGFSPALLQAAMVRGRFAELLAQGLLSRSESENLFFVGMFSLLDQLLGIPIQEVLGEILLPDAVVQALLTRDGAYGPFLTLVEACEQKNGCAADEADALFMTAQRVNQAHMAALAWAHRFKT